MPAHLDQDAEPASVSEVTAVAQRAAERRPYPPPTNSAAPRLLRAPRRQRAVLIGGSEFVQTAEGFAVDEDLREAR
jgi:hypothetical protein